jgi:hypothetical protein
VSKIFVIEGVTKKGEAYYLEEKGEFESRLTSPSLKKWKTQRGAENYLESISDSLKEYSDLKKVSVVERSQEIQAAFDEEEVRKFEIDFDSIRSLATKGSVVNSGSVYREMLLRLAEGLVSLTEGDSVLYFSEGYTKDYNLVPVEKVGISTFSAGGITVSRLTGDYHFLPNDSELVNYFVAYKRIQEFIKKNWEVVEPLDLIRISTALSELEQYPVVEVESEF